MGRLAQRAYYAFQRIRRGVSPAMVGRAADLLERPWADVRSYVRGRLERNYDLSGTDGFEWLTEQPVRTKGHYRDRNGRGAEGPTFLGASLQRRTSGSSGKPFVFRRDRAMLAWMDAAMWAVYGWYGIEPGDRMARFWGRPLSGADRLKRSAADVLLRQKRLNAFDVSMDRSRDFYRELLRWDPEYAYGYPTLIGEFVEHLRVAGEDGCRLGLDLVITTGELLDRSTRRSLEEFFGCPVADEYGCSEAGILGFECPSGSMHMIPVAAYTEVAGEPADPDRVAEGQVLTTDLYGEVRPFVRYALDDMVRIDPAEECGCGRELPSLEVLTGRAGALIRLPDGREMYHAVLAYSVPEGVTHFQVEQTAVDELEGRIVVGDGVDREDVLQECREHWRDAVGAGMKVRVRAVDRIAPTDSGKRRYFIPLEQG